MSLDNSNLPLVAIVGPTASGKSALATWLAERLGGEVVACDSTQLYRGFDVGTAKPNLAARRGVPHHLIDVLKPGENATAGAYRQMAAAVLAELRARGRLPILTVGTGLYLRALLEGLAEAPQRSEALRERLRARGAERGSAHLHGILKRIDPAAAGKIAPRDQQKLIRAIEVCLLAKKPLSQIHESGRTPLVGWRVFKLGLMPTREALYQCIQERTDTMLQQGWLDEVRALLSSGLAENAKPFDFIGYRELRAALRGEMSIEEARGAIQQATRRYAKRQLTWFRKEPNVHWLVGFGDESNVQNDALKWIKGQSVAESASDARSN